MGTKFSLCGNLKLRLLALLLLAVLIPIAGFVLPSSVGLLPAFATKLPAETKKLLDTIYPAGIQRLDGSVELPDHNFLLPLIPGSNSLKKPKSEGTLKYPLNSDEPELIVHDNGWVHMKTERKGSSVTLKIPDGVPDTVRKRLLTLHLPSDLIVPNGFVLSRSMKGMMGELTIPLVEDVALMKPSFGPKLGKPAQAPDHKGAGTFALVSIKDGTIVLMDAKSFSKLAEFPTEGTPSSMTYVDGTLYIADQAKSRILLLDPVGRRFLGQIDLPPNTAPKGIVAVPNGKWVYVSLSGTSEVAIVETENGKVLLKTKVPTGPGRLMVSPDGIYVSLLSVTAAELSVIASYNQRMIGSVKVGEVPTCMAMHPTEKIAYVSNRRANTVSIVDLTKRVVSNTIKTGNSPTGVAVSPDGTKLYVAHGRDNTIIIYDTSTQQKLQEVKLPLDVDFPHSICLTPDGKHLIVTSQQTDTVGVLDTTTLEFTKQVQLGHTTQECLWLPGS